MNVGSLIFKLNSLGPIKSEEEVMFTDQQILIIALVFIGLVLIAILGGLIIQFGYINPNFFYGDEVVLSHQDPSGNTWWVRNNAKTMDLTRDQSQAAVLRFAHGLSGARGQIFETDDETTFELAHPYYGAFLTATCQSVTTNPVPGFSTTSGSQYSATSLTTSTSKALRDGGQYALILTGIDCEASGCTIQTCDVSGCFFTVAANTDSAIVDSEGTMKVSVARIECPVDNTTPQLWTFTKVVDRSLYKETQTTEDVEFNTDDDY